MIKQETSRGTEPYGDHRKDLSPIPRREKRL